MSKIIKKFENENYFWICDVSHTPINLTPFTNPTNWSFFDTFFKHKKIFDISNFKIDKEYSENEFNILLRKNKIKTIKNKIL